MCFFSTHTRSVSSLPCCDAVMRSLASTAGMSGSGQRVQAVEEGAATVKVAGRHAEASLRCQG